MFPEIKIQVINERTGYLEANFVFNGRTFTVSFDLHEDAAIGDTPEEIFQKIRKKCNEYLREEERYFALISKALQYEQRFIIRGEEVSVKVLEVDANNLSWEYQWRGSRYGAQRGGFYARFLDARNESGLSEQARRVIQEITEEEIEKKLRLPAIEGFIRSLRRD